MALPVQTVKNFLNDAYQLISANSPTVPLQGNDQSKGLQFLNELVSSYSGTGLLLTIPKEINFPIIQGEEVITFTDPSVTIPPTSATNINQGRLANVQNVFLVLDNVSYPLFIEDRNIFKSSYKFVPLLGLPRFAIPVYYDNYTELTIYPAPSQGYQLFIFGKFELSQFDINGTMAALPNYYIRFFRLAVARDLAFYKGRSEAWTDKLEKMYQDALKDTESVSPINICIETAHESLLNGAYRVRAGI